MNRIVLQEYKEEDNKNNIDSYKDDGFVAVIGIFNTVRKNICLAIQSKLSRLYSLKLSVYTYSIAVDQAFIINLPISTL